jgi:hypothetical protein
MVRTFERAIAEVAALPDADQELIGRQLLSHVENLRRLREELDKGVRSLATRVAHGGNAIICSMVSLTVRFQ